MAAPSSRKAEPRPIDLGVPWLSIRFQISSLLLLSALNAIVVVAYTVALVASQAEPEGVGGASTAAALLAQVTPVHREVVAGDAEPADLEPLLANLGGLLLDMDDLGRPALEALGATAMPSTSP